MNSTKRGEWLQDSSFKFKQKKPKQAEITTETPKNSHEWPRHDKPLTEPQIAKYSMIQQIRHFKTSSNFQTIQPCKLIGNILRNPEKADKQIVKRIFTALETETTSQQLSAKI